MGAMKAEASADGKSWDGLASLCSLAIALWGWQTGLWWLALPMIVGLESRHVATQRWEISLSDLKEVAKLCGVILSILSVVSVILEKEAFIYSLIQWLPVAAFPLALAQTYALGIQVLLGEGFSKAYLQHQGRYRQQRSINLYYFYFAICLLAASAADSNRFSFYGFATVLVALLLYAHRPKRSAPIIWLLLFCLSAGLGFVGHVQISHLQQRLEEQMIAMLSDFASGAISPESNTTRMGSVGKLKLSSKIAFRVSTDSASVSPKDPSLFPLLLREATYNRYQLSTWGATDALFKPVPAAPTKGTWQLAPTHPQDISITIADNLKRGKGVLTLPSATTEIRQLNVTEMQKNQYGTVQVDATGNATYQVRFDPDAGATDAPPTETDLQIPIADSAAIAQTLQRLAVENKSNSEIISQVAAYFQTFKYSLDLIRTDGTAPPISDFLLNTQAGHCEYFASATALLLRGAGIPARYVVGYSVHEFSPLERQYIVRSRDAHAWTLVYFNGAWQAVDTTPPDWRSQEKEQASSWQIFSDFAAFLSFQFQIKLRQLRDLSPPEIMLLLTPLFGFLLWKSFHRFKGRRANPLEDESKNEWLPSIQNGLDSEFYEIAQQLEERDLARSPSESLLQWSLRLNALLSEAEQNTFSSALALHYRYRFDPQGLTPAERAQLTALSQNWLSRYH
ncbi:MAG: hypothetical protein DCF15_07905 [Phormidesmis priestleyi]|uniref:Transglutaminase-like domain-containing protein n=1 Tax=Phormidesmis priestleyi TaxID=268141 RepID=A0A2W4ZFJ8_9CYAN|nr:MAG: hypothetical protein DCF15_07905 [Phormidesmis priestleyi]